MTDITITTPDGFFYHYISGGAAPPGSVYPSSTLVASSPAPDIVVGAEFFTSENFGIYYPTGTEAWYYLGP